MSRKVFATICVLVVLLCAFAILGGHSQAPLPSSLDLQDQQADWPQRFYNGIEIRIALNDVRTNRDEISRTIFILADPSNFTEDKLKTIFVGLSEENREPVKLYIDAYSNEEMLLHVVKEHLCPGCTRAEDEERIKLLRQKFYIHFAYYYRSHDEERFNYTPSPDEEPQTMWLKRKPIPYTGDLDHDLILAASEGDTAKVKEMLAKGAKVNAKDKDGSTALMHAALGGYAGIVDLLLDAGANVNAKNFEGWTALIYAGSGAETEIIHNLLLRGAKIDAQNSYGDTALILAAAHGFTETVELLLKNGADVNLRNNDGETALIRAAIKNDIESIKVLIVRGANLNSRNKKGETALYYAKKSGSDEVVQLLIKAGAKK